MKTNRHSLVSYFRQMSSRDRQKMESESLKDPFLSDALDGFSEHPEALNALKKMDRRYYNGRNRLLKFSVVLFVSILGIVLYQQSNHQRAHQTQHPSNSHNIRVKTIPSEQLQSMAVLPKEKVLQPHKIQKEFKAKDKGMVFKPNVKPDFPSEELVQLPMYPIGKVDRNPAKNRQNFAMETYVNDLKVLDYRYYRKRARQEKSTLLTGTPAAQETNVVESSQKDIVEVSYMNFLSETLQDFNRGEYKAALVGFDQILSTYPDDVNALFYSSLCLYNLKQFGLCEQRLKVMELAKFDNFDEEQNWYLLLCYKAMGKTQEFNNLKQNIIQRNGFYAVKAAALNQ